MRASVDITINAPRDVVWSIVSDIEGAGKTISGIESLEVLERPNRGLLGLKWKETRTIFGKTATETMWITRVDEGRSYTTEARSHGSIYRTEVRAEDVPGGTRLSMEMSAAPTNLVARLLGLIFGFLMRRSVRDALMKDLEDIKRAAESRRTTEQTGR